MSLRTWHSAWAQNWANERPRQYVMTMVVFWNFCACANTAFALGWNVWVDQLFEVFYGDVEYTMARGGVVYALSLIIFMICIGNLMIALLGALDPEKTFNICGWKFQGGQVLKMYIWGLLISTLSGIMLGVAVQYKQMWLMYVGSVGLGIGMAMQQPVFRFAANLAYYQVGQKGIGTGWLNACPGIWATTFSYWGPALSNSLSIQTAIHIANGISLAILLVPIPFTNVKIPNRSIYHQRSSQRLAAIMREMTDEERENRVEPFPLPAMVILKSKEMIIMWFAFLFMMTPGFGIKYLISPMLDKVYGASDSVQDTASFIFLLLYSISRFLGGALDYLFDAMVMMRIINACAVPVMILQGWLATQYDSDAALYGFIACQCVAGVVLGASKVLICILCFDVYAPVNFTNSCGELLSVFGVAAYVGPVLGWWSLSGHGMPGDPNYQVGLSDSVAIFCYASAGSLALSCTLMFFVKPLDFSKYLQYRKDVPVETEEDIEDAGEETVMVLAVRESVAHQRFSTAMHPKHQFSKKSAFSRSSSVFLA